MTSAKDKCNRIMTFAPPKEVDSFAEKQLTKELKKYESSIKEKLADISFKVDKKVYSSLFDAIYFIEDWEELEIDFYHPNLEKIWEYDTPTKLIKITKSGRGALMLFQIDPFALKQWNPDQEPIVEPAMFRCYSAQFYSPESIKTQSKKYDERPLVPPRPLCTLFEFWEDIRFKGIVPFQMNLCAYSKKRRYLYQLDLVNNSLIMDFRNGKIPIKNRKYRDPMDYYRLDYFLSTQEIPHLTKNVLTTIFELEDANAADIEIGLGITEKMAQDHIKALARRDIVEAKGKKSPDARYVINLETLRSMMAEK